jgi:hypothetical protein
MAKRRKSTKSKSKSPARRRSRKPQAFLKSREGKMVVHVGGGAAVAGLVEAQGLGQQYASSLPGGQATLTALGFVALSALVKKGQTKAMLRSMAVGAAGVAVYNAVTDSPAVQNLQIPGPQQTAQSALTALPGGKQASAAISNYVNKQAPVGARG